MQGIQRKGRSEEHGYVAAFFIGGVMDRYRITIKSLALIPESAHVEIGVAIPNTSFESCVQWSRSLLPLEGTYLVTVVSKGFVHKDTIRK